MVLVAHMLQAMRPVLARIDAALPIKGGVANSDIIRSYLGLLTQGKRDFDTVENFRGDAFFKQSLGIGLLPSSPTPCSCRALLFLAAAGQGPCSDRDCVPSARHGQSGIVLSCRPCPARKVRCHELHLQL